jgi:lipopolysaccharide export system permease protein
MKKILFRKLLFDCLFFLVISLLSSSLIIWIFQAVNFLDIMVEDGRDYVVYLKYSLLNFPKIISKIIPFAIFFSFFYVLTKYELNNELIIFWNFGINKIELINFIIKCSILLTFLQLIFTIYIVPETQNISRSLIRTSNIDFFENFIKPKKFNDNVRGLTIYSEEKAENGDLRNIYLKKNKSNKEFQITIAKKGVFETKNDIKILVLFDGQTINSVNNKVTNFSFSKSDFNLSTFETDAIIYDKIQETKTSKHVRCLVEYLNKDLTKNKNQREYIDFNCSIDALDNIFQELYKRFVIPLYIPLLISVSLLLIITSKEKKSYLRFRLGVFLSGLSIIIISETTLKFITDDFYYNLKIILLPFFIFTSLYIFLKLNLKNKINFKN